MLCSRISLPLKELLSIEAIISEMAPFTVVNVDMAKAIGVDDSEFVIFAVGV